MKVQKIVIDVIRLKNEAFRQGLYKTGNALAKAEKEIGWELADSAGKSNIKRAKEYRKKNKAKVFSMTSVEAKGEGYPPNSAQAKRPDLWHGRNWRWLMDLEAKEKTKKKRLLAKKAKTKYTAYDR